MNEGQGNMQFPLSKEMVFCNLPEFPQEVHMPVCHCHKIFLSTLSLHLSEGWSGLTKIAGCEGAGPLCSSATLVPYSEIIRG